MSRTQRSAWNLASAFLYAVVSLATGFFATPLILFGLGPERFGAFRAITDGVSHLAVLELGIGASLSALLVPAIAGGRLSQVRGILGAGVRAYGWTIILKLGAGLLWAAVLPSLIYQSGLDPFELRGAALVYIGIVFLTPFQAFRQLAEASQRGYLVNVSFAMHSAFFNALCLFAACQGWGLIGQGAAALVAAACPLLILAGSGLGYFQGVRSLLDSRGDAERRLWRLNWSLWAHELGVRVSLLSDNLIVAWFLGPAVVTPFFLTQRLTTLVQMQLRHVGSSTWAGFSELHAMGQRETLKQRFLELTGLVSGLGVVILAPVAAYNEAFMSLWVGGGNFLGQPVSLLSCANMWAWSVFSLWLGLMAGWGIMAAWVPYSVIGTLVNLLISVLGTRAWGPLGPLLGTSAGFLLVNSWGLTRVLASTQGLSPARLWSKVLGPLVWGLPYALLLWMSAAAREKWAWTGLLAEMGFSILGGALLWWTLNLGRAERESWIARLRDSLGAAKR